MRQTMRQPAKATPPASAEATVRVLVVDDSLIARAVYTRLIDGESDLALVAQASSAEQALDLLREIGVDVILLDLQMPGMGGLDALPRIMALAPLAKVLVVSSLTVEGGEHTVAALALGAADTLPKPEAGRFDRDYRARLVDQIRALGQSGVTRRLRRRVPAPAQTVSATPSAPEAIPVPSRVLGRVLVRAPRVLAIGASTGGILALRQFFEALPPRIGMPILVTQHLPVSFLPAFAGQVARFASRPARLAEQGTMLVADEVVIAPGDAHLLVDAVGDQLVVRLARERADTGCLPSVDPMLASLASATGGQALAVVLTGMGKDGTRGARALVEAGGSVLVQDEATSAVWGMPGSIANAGLAAEVLPPSLLAARVPVLKGGA